MAGDEFVLGAGSMKKYYNNLVVDWLVKQGCKPRPAQSIAQALRPDNRSKRKYSPLLP